MKTIVINNSIYDLGVLIKKYGTTNITEIEKCVVEAQVAGLEKIEDAKIELDNNLDEAARLARAVGAPLDTDLIKFTGGK